MFGTAKETKRLFDDDNIDSSGTQHRVEKECKCETRVSGDEAGEREDSE